MPDKTNKKKKPANQSPADESKGGETHQLAADRSATHDDATGRAGRRRPEHAHRRPSVARSCSKTS